MSMKKLLGMAAIFAAISNPNQGEIELNTPGEFTQPKKPNRKRIKPKTFKKQKHKSNPHLYSKHK